MKKYFIPLLAFVIAFFVDFNSVNAQKKIESVVKIDGEVSKPLTIHAADFKKIHRIEVVRKDRDGKDHHYTGELLSNLLIDAGATMGAQLRGENLAKYVLVEAVDGYKVIFTLAELDEDFTDRKIILADEMDGKPLPVSDGPFRIIVENELKPARCIKQVVSIKVGVAE